MPCGRRFFGMKLYFSPLACSMATRIALYETGQRADFVEVDPKSDAFRAVNSLGLVPVLEDDDGTRLTENAAILQHVGGPDLAPRDPRLTQWLSFVGTELHKGIYGVLLDREAPPEAKAYALSKAKSRLDWTSERLTGRDFVLDRFSVADAYLVTVLGWSVATPIDLSSWPVLMSYVARLRERPTVARALSEELPLWAKGHPQEAKTVRSKLAAPAS